MNYTTIDMVIDLMRREYAIVSDNPDDLIRVLAWLDANGYTLSRLAKSVLKSETWPSPEDGVIYCESANPSWFGLGQWNAKLTIPYAGIRHLFEDDVRHPAPQVSSREELAAFIGNM